MSQTLTSELHAGFLALIFGLCLGLLYDGFRILRILLGIRDGGALPSLFARIRPPVSHVGRTAKPRRLFRAFLVFLCDFFYALFSGIAFCVFLYAAHDGVFRLFLLAATALGMALYFLTLGRLVSRVCGALAYLLRVLLSYLFLCLRTPLILALRLCAFALRALLSGLLLLAERVLSPASAHMRLRRACHATRTFFTGITRPA